MISQTSDFATLVLSLAIHSLNRKIKNKLCSWNNIFVFFFDLLCLDLICLFCFVYIMFCWTLQILDMLVNFESIDLIDKGKHRQSLVVQLTIFDFTIVWKCHAFSKIHTLNFDLFPTMNVWYDTLLWCWEGQWATAPSQPHDHEGK